MPTFHARQVVTALLAAPVVAAVLWSGVQAMALRNAVEAGAMLGAAPTAVATVDLNQILEKANQTGTWKIQITNLVQGIADEGKARQEKLKSMKDEADKIKDPAQRQQALDGVALEQLRAEEWLKLRQVEVDREKSLMWQSIMRTVREESKKVAEAEGYQLVLLDDSSMKIEPDSTVNAPRETQVKQQIGSLRVLYGAKTIDITEKVIVRINNASAAK
ncbi:MAG: OmpH family outer membrane protein [Phycisphaerales bacterium]